LKWSEEIRQAFIEQFAGTDFTREEVEEFIKPYFDLDPEKAYRQALAREAQRLIASYRDSRNVRDCFGFELDGQLKFGWPLYTSDLIKLEKMEERLIKQKMGLEKSIAKVQSRIWLLKHQVTIFDVINNRKSEDTQQPYSINP